MNGETRPQAFEELLKRSPWMREAAFDHALRNLSQGDFIERVIQERWLFAGGRLEALPPITVAIFPDGGFPDGGEERFRRTLESCLLQSSPSFRLLVIARPGEEASLLARLAEERLARDACLRESFAGRLSFGATLREALDGDRPPRGYLLCARAGDALHPSLVTSLQLELAASPEAADLYFWNEALEPGGERRDGGPALLRKPDLEPFTLLHLNYLSHGFAFRAGEVSEYEGFERELEQNDLHLFLLRLLWEGNRTAVGIPQCLSARPAESGREGPERIEPFRDAYRAFFKRLDLEMQPGEGSIPYRLDPAARARRASVIISFRDRPALTLEAVRSVLDQDFDGALEVLLIDNRSSAASLDEIGRFAEGIGGRSRCRLLRYDPPFNHSAQCNLGAREASGDCLVFLNNDARLGDRWTLRRMAGWAMYPGIGTVGVRVIDPGTGELVSAGIVPPLAPGAEDQAIVEESRRPEYSRQCRETLGNTFACAAVSRRTFLDRGGLDDLNFPIGYNDADFNLRCRRAGLRNLYLGDAHALHRPRTSRPLADEISQRLLLRRRFPEVLERSLHQLRQETAVNHAAEPPLRHILKALCRWPFRKAGELRRRMAGQGRA